MKERTVLAAIAILSTFAVILSQTQSPFEHQRYWPEAWRGSSNSEIAPYWADIPAVSALLGEPDFGSSDLAGCYPLTTGLVVTI